MKDSSVILRALWMKKTKKTGKTKTRMLLMDQGSLYMSKNEKTDKISGVIQLAFVKVEFLL